LTDTGDSKPKSSVPNAVHGSRTAAHMTYESIRQDAAIRTYIRQADASLMALGYTEHSFAHVTRVAETTGDILCTMGFPDREAELGKIADSYISKGQLIPDDLMIDILSHVLDTHEETKSGVIFDGFPRTIAQAQALDVMLKERGTAVSAVIGLEVEESELIDRLLKRGQVSGRSDDNLETIQKRLDVYHNQTTPLKDFYIAEGKYKAIHGMGTVEEIFHTIKESIISL